MKPAADSKSPHHLLESMLTVLVTAAAALLIAAAGWAVWEFVMGMVGENWPEWLRLCGIR